jgi:hypothetical protein
LAKLDEGFQFYWEEVKHMEVFAVGFAGTALLFRWLLEKWLGGGEEH